MQINTPQCLKHTAIVCTLLVAMLVAGCSNRAERAAEYNDSIIGYQKQIIAAFDIMDSTFRDTGATKDLVDFAYANLQSKVKLGILALDSVGSFQKDPSMQLAAKELFIIPEHVFQVAERNGHRLPGSTGVWAPFHGRSIPGKPCSHGLGQRIDVGRIAAVEAVNAGLALRGIAVEEHLLEFV